MFKEPAELASIQSPLATGCICVWALLGLNLEQDSGSSLPISLKIPLASGAPALRGPGLGNSPWVQKENPFRPRPSLLPQAQVKPCRASGQAATPNAPLLLCHRSFPRLPPTPLPLQFTFSRFYLSHRDNKMCRGMWRIETKWARREAPVYLHKGTYFTPVSTNCSPVGARGMMAGWGWGGGGTCSPHV